MFFKKAIQAIVLCGVVLTAGVAPSASALETKPVLSVEIAEKMALACDKYAASKGWKVNIAVLDDGGGLLYFRRHPGQSSRFGSTGLGTKAIRSRAMVSQVNSATTR